MFCSKCGAKAVDGAVFCYKCGSRIIGQTQTSSNEYDANIAHSVKAYSFIPTKSSDNFIGTSELKEIFNRSLIFPEDDINEYEHAVEQLSIYNDEQVRANLIIKLLYMTTSIVPDIEDFSDRLVIFRGIKYHILEYLKADKDANSKYMAFVFMMTYIYISILSGHFSDARNMFCYLMKNKELIITSKEIERPTHTSILYKYESLFSHLYATYYNVAQMALIVGDSELLSTLIECDGLKGIATLWKSVAQRTINSCKLDGRDDVARYWQTEIDRLNSIDCIQSLYGIGHYECYKFYQSTYEFEEYPRFISEEAVGIVVRNDALQIEGVGVLSGLNKMIMNYKPSRIKLSDIIKYTREV